MNYFQPYSPPLGDAILAAWDSQVAEAEKAPWLAEALARYGDELFPRFAESYAELRALPRGARRALQRKLSRSRELAAALPEWLQEHSGAALQRKLAWSMAGAALLLALGQVPAQAATPTLSTATITVTRNTPPDINDGDGKCSLIEAILNANYSGNYTTGPYYKYYDCAAGALQGQMNVIELPQGKQTLTYVYGYAYGYYGSNSGPIGLPLITSRITISGHRTATRTDSTITRSKNAPDFRLMAVRGDCPDGCYLGDLTLDGVTLSGGAAYNSYYGYDDYAGGAVYNYYGKLTITHSTISGNTAENGGGVANVGGTLVITNSTITGNRAYDEDYDGYYAYGRGGGVYNHNDAGSMNIVNSTISKNSAHQGGGVFNYNDTKNKAFITGSTISGNQAYDEGGGVYNLGDGYLNIVGSTISNNKAVYGGGIYNDSGATLYVLDSVISKNSAASGGGGVSNDGYFYLDAFYIGANLYYASNYSTITKNKAGTRGGGVANYFDFTYAPGSTIKGNKAPSGPNVYD